ncbi:MAG: PIN domain-containing protein [Gammaproteobacteria bacterium]|nr:PIN domain-containing protein [Gammaproteobacteria bacterium]
MIAVDTSSFIAYLQGENAKDVLWVDEALSSHVLVFPPVVASEILSDGTLPTKLVVNIKHLPLLPITSDFWYRAGRLRSQLLAKKLKARLADTLIAQSCIDHQVPLITRDLDFRHYVKHGGLILFEG